MLYPTELPGQLNFQRQTPESEVISTQFLCRVPSTII